MLYVFPCDTVFLTVFGKIMSEELEKNEKEMDEKTNRVYEVGLLLIPNLATEKVNEEFSSIKSSIEKSGGKFISEESPYLRPLAYTIVKSIDTKNQKFDNAYFGWVKFEIDTANLEEVNTALKSNENILRFINVKTVRESTYTPSRQISQPSIGESGSGDLDSVISQSEIDSGIDKLLVE